MKLHLIDRRSPKNSSFTIKNDLYPYFLKIWHCHPELELVAILKSTGTRFIGDNIEKFEAGDLVLIGKNLPHLWLNDQEYFEESSNLKAEAIAIHFKENFLGYDLLTSPEMLHLSSLFKKARYGVKFMGVDNKVIDSIKHLLRKEGFEQVISFLKILDLLAKHSKYELLASEGYEISINKPENKKLEEVYAYIFNNFNKEINLNAVAQIAHMNTSAFSRFFKRVNRKTFSSYVNEIRIGYACKLLIENKYIITTICYESGFKNVSNFNRQFKRIKNMSPTEYLNRYNEIG